MEYEELLNNGLRGFIGRHKALSPFSSRALN